MWVKTDGGSLVNLDNVQLVYVDTNAFDTDVRIFADFVTKGRVLLGRYPDEASARDLLARIEEGLAGGVWSDVTGRTY